MSFNAKVYKNTSFKDHRGYYWTSWKKNLTKKIKFNSNIIEFFYYGNLKVLIKSLSLNNILYEKINGCIISTK